MYIYGSHLGGIYVCEEEMDPDTLFCHQCGDSDECLGEFNSATEFLQKYADEIDANDGFGGYAMGYIMEVLNCFPDCPSEENACKIVRENRTMSLEDREDYE